MLIHLNTDDSDVVTRVLEEIRKDSPESTIHTSPGYVHHYLPGTGNHVVTHGFLDMPIDRAEYRWTHLRLASLGGQFWTDIAEEALRSPYFTGSFDSIADLRQVVVHAKYAENRATYLRSFGVSYIGRVTSDPRILVLVDNRKDKTFNPADNPDIRDLLASQPESKQQELSWGSVGIVSAGNVDKLENFLDYMSESNVVAYSTGAFSKLRYLGRDYATVGAPSPEPEYGMKLRDAASRLRPALTS